jgi:hypothetical protein
MARTGRGGTRTPRNPAPVSGPGALSRRTDRGQPIRVAPGAPYGQRKALEDQQRAAPLASIGGTQPTVGGGAARGPMPSLTAPPSAPGPPGSGLPAMQATQQLATLDPDALIRLMYRKFPHPALARLLHG